MAVPWKWAAKAVVQKTISVLPDSDRLNHAVQRVTGRDEFGDQQIDNRLDLAAMHVEAMVRAGVADAADGLPAGSRVAELGTGWHPAIPILMHLVGADEILTIDHVDHSSDELLVATIRGLAGAISDGRVAAALPSVRSDRCERLVELAEKAERHASADLLTELGIRSIVADVREVTVGPAAPVTLAAEVSPAGPVAPASPAASATPGTHDGRGEGEQGEVRGSVSLDAAETPTSAGGGAGSAGGAVAPMDAVVSNLVLEHIPREILGSVVESCFDLVRSGGVMSHVIDLCDHGSYVDPALSQFNFLRFGERAWRTVGNDVQHENRIRESEVAEIYASVDVPIDWSSNRRGDWPDLARVPLAEPFRHMDRDDLLVVMTHPVSVRP